MNRQLAKTLNSISQRLPKIIRGLETAYNTQANITVEKIDRPLLLTQGEIQDISDCISSNPKGLRKEFYNSSYLALFKDQWTYIPSSVTVDFKLTQKGIDIWEFLFAQGDISDLKAIIHFDLFQSYDYDPFKVNIHWLKIQVAIPKDNKTPTQLVQDEIERRSKLQRFKDLREELRP